MDLKNNWKEAGYSKEELIALTGIYSYQQFKSIYIKEVSGTKEKIKLSIRTGPVLIISDFYPSEKFIRNLTIISTEPGKHIGFKIFNSQVQYATQMSLNKISCDAFGNSKSDFVGYIVWGKFGFQMTKKDDIDFFDQKLLQFQKEKGLNTLNIKTLEHLLRDPDGYNFWKMQGKTWYGEFDLGVGSESNQILKRYKNSRGL